MENDAFISPFLSYLNIWEWKIKIFIIIIIIIIIIIYLEYYTILTYPSYLIFSKLKFGS